MAKGSSGIRDTLAWPPAMFAVSILLGLVIWEVCARALPHSILAPLPDIVAFLFGNLGELSRAFVRSLGHMLTGYFLAILVALPLGFLLGRSKTLYQIFDPIINAIYSIPSVGLVPFFIIWFGLFFPSRVALVFFMCVFEILLTVIAGVRDVNGSYISVARSFGASQEKIITKVIFPAALPFVFTALRIGAVRAVDAMISAELFFAAVNLGAIMKDRANHFDIAGLWGVVIMLALFGLAVQAGMRWLEAFFLRWRTP